MGFWAILLSCIMCVPLSPPVGVCVPFVIKTAFFFFFLKNDVKIGYVTTGMF